MIVTATLDDPARGAPVALCAAMPIAAEVGPLPGWVHLLPAGEITTMDGRGPYRVPDPAALVASSLAGFGRLPVDENHATDLAAPQGHPAPARGWITGLQSRADGIWGEVEWNDSGRQLVADRAYRHISPVIAHRPDGAVTAILRASLVNRPNLKGLVALHAEEQLTHFAGSVQLDRDEARIIRMLGITPENYAKARAKIAREESAHGGSNLRP